MREVLSAPSPVSLEGAMTFGVLKPYFETFAPKTWGFHTFRGGAQLVVDTHPGRSDMLTVMICGHADKIRMQVRHISEDGKVYVNSDSFLPLTLIGNPVHIFSERQLEPAEATDSAQLLRFGRLSGTVEALGAIHFADPKARSGAKGVKPEDLYVELGVGLGYFAQLCLHCKRREEAAEAASRIWPRSELPGMVSANGGPV